MNYQNAAFYRLGRVVITEISMVWVNSDTWTVNIYCRAADCQKKGLAIVNIYSESFDTLGQAIRAVEQVTEPFTPKNKPGAGTDEG